MLHENYRIKSPSKTGNREYLRNYLDIQFTFGFRKRAELELQFRFKRNFCEGEIASMYINSIYRKMPITTWHQYQNKSWIKDSIFRCLKGSIPSRCSKPVCIQKDYWRSKDESGIGLDNVKNDWNWAILNAILLHIVENIWSILFIFSVQIE